MLDSRAGLWVIAGPPGAGKTTVADMLLSQRRPMPALLDENTMYGSFVAATLRSAGRSPLHTEPAVAHETIDNRLSATVRSTCRSRGSWLGGGRRPRHRMAVHVVPEPRPAGPPLPAALLESRVFAIARGRFTVVEIMGIATALADGGIGGLEITMNSDDAGQLIAELAESTSRLVIGAGTVLGVADAEIALQAGAAAFLVTPHCDPSIVSWARAHGLPVITGAHTPTEIHTAWMAGAAAIRDQALPIDRRRAGVPSGGAGAIRAYGLRDDGRHHGRDSRRSPRCRSSDGGSRSLARRSRPRRGP